MALILRFHTKYILNPRSMNFNPAKVSLTILQFYSKYVLSAYYDMVFQKCMINFSHFHCFILEYYLVDGTNKMWAKYKESTPLIHCCDKLEWSDGIKTCFLGNYCSLNSEIRDFQIEWSSCKTFSLLLWISLNTGQASAKIKLDE